MVVGFAFRERSALAREVDGIIFGIERRTASDDEAIGPRGASLPAHVEELLDEAIQTESQQLAVVAVNELLGRASLARSRALLLSRGLPRIALLSGGGGAFVVAAVGNFSKNALVAALGSVLLGVMGAMTSHGLNASSRRLAKRYVGVTDVLARQIDQHFNSKAAD